MDPMGNGLILVNHGIKISWQNHWLLMNWTVMEITSESWGEKQTLCLFFGAFLVVTNLISQRWVAYVLTAFCWDHNCSIYQGFCDNSECLGDASEFNTNHQSWDMDGEWVGCVPTMLCSCKTVGKHIATTKLLNGADYETSPAVTLLQFLGS